MSFQRMSLICNHPELAGKEADAGTLTTHSKQEQSQAGLDQCSADELTQLQSLNRVYREKFEFPFVVHQLWVWSAAHIRTQKHGPDAHCQVRLEPHLAGLPSCCRSEIQDFLDNPAYLLCCAAGCK